MVSGIDSGDTSQWRAVEWAWAQGEHLTQTEVTVLVYLVSHAFYKAKNPEGGTPGQVMYQASYVSEMMRATATKSRSTVRAALNGLQDKGYIQRIERPDAGAGVPHKIFVLWDLDALQEGIREGRQALPPQLRKRPVKPVPKAPPRWNSAGLRLVVTNSDEGDSS